MSEAMIQETAQRLFSGNVDKHLLEKFESGEWPSSLWRLAVDNGLSFALATEAAGGIAASWSEAYPILRGLGYWQVPLPLAETMIAGLVLSRAGQAVPEQPIALVDEEQAARLEWDAAGLCVSGVARRVPWASRCQWALVSLPDQLVVVDLSLAATVSITKRNNTALEPDDEVLFSRAPCLVRFANPFPDIRQPLRVLAAGARCAMMVGAMEWLLEQSVQYAMDRVQFGKPIGRNQAIQHALALLAGEVTAARVAAKVALADMPDAGSISAQHALFSVAVAKVRCGESATRAAAISHQVHGAIGFTYEHALNFATRRLWAWRESYGTDAWWAQRLGEAAIAGRAKGFWPSVTARHMEHLK